MLRARAEGAETKQQASFHFPQPQGKEWTRWKQGNMMRPPAYENTNTATNAINNGNCNQKDFI